MPPRPISSRISSWGKRGASSSGVGGTKAEAFGLVESSVGKPAFNRHSWHKPVGALGARVFPQLGQRGVVFIFFYPLLLETRTKVTGNVTWLNGCRVTWCSCTRLSHVTMQRFNHATTLILLLASKPTPPSPPRVN